MNKITIDNIGAAKVQLTKKSAETLREYVPKGCPFENYTLFDLLKDSIEMYSWKFPCTTMTIQDYVMRIMEIEAHMKSYGAAIIACLD